MTKIGRVIITCDSLEGDPSKERIHTPVVGLMSAGDPVVIGMLVRLPLCEEIGF